MCNKKATSREHVPPLCFFPEQMDLPRGLDYRLNLITVPSCHHHNLPKSKDDEYAFFVIFSTGGNLAAQRHFSTKVLRAIAKRNSLLRLITNNPRPALYDWRPTMAFEVDRKRFDKAMEFIARGSFLHHFGVKWLDKIAIVSPAILAVEGNAPLMVNRQVQSLAEVARRLFENEPRFGANQDIFYYQVYRDTALDQKMVRIVFYRSAVVQASTYPKNLAISERIVDFSRKSRQPIPKGHP